MTTTTLDARIAARRAALTQQRAERQDELDLPRTLTQRQVNEYLKETAPLDQKIATFNAVVAAHAALPSPDADARWHDFLVPARATICDELLQIKRPVRDREVKRRADDLEFCLRLIDQGFGIAPLGILTLEPTRIGELMAAAGYATSGQDLHGPNGWRGSLPEVERKLADLARRQAAALAALGEVLLTDEERAARDAEDAELRGAFNAMGVRLSGDPNVPGLVAFTADGDVLDVAAMTPLQRKAFERANAEYAPKRSEPAA